ncbi:FAD-dependent oxidoreductase [Candidatus Latescibacterota bacterium]
MSDQSSAQALKIPVKTGDSYDVIVIGGGVSGSIAGIAAARHGAKTLIAEQHGFLGGALTAMGVGPMMSFHNNAGRQVVKGLPQELVERLEAHGASPGHIPDSITYCSTVTPFDSEQLKIELESMLEEAGGTVEYHAHFFHAVIENERITSVVLGGPSGAVRHNANIFIDGTGDAVLATNAGAPVVLGRPTDNATQPMTMNLKVGNVDTDAVRRFVIENPDDFHFTLGAEEGLRRLEKTPRLSLAGYLREWHEAIESGEVKIPRELVLFFETAEPGVIIINTSRIQGLDPTNPADISNAETIGRSQCLELFRFLKHRCRGFEHAVNLGTSAHIGVRESRHIEGLYTITADDLIGERDFEDTIALGGYPIDIHSPDKAETNSTHLKTDAVYQIPLRSMLVEVLSNLVVVGRPISATHEASAAIRVSPIAMAIGQAGGTLAACAVKDGTDPNVYDYRKLRTALIHDGVKLV